MSVSNSQETPSPPKGEIKENIFSSCRTTVELFKALSTEIQVLLMDATTEIQQIEQEFSELQNHIELKRAKQTEVNEKLLEQKARFEKEIQSFFESISIVNFPGISKS